METLQLFLESKREFKYGASYVERIDLGYQDGERMIKLPDNHFYKLTTKQAELVMNWIAESFKVEAKSNAWDDQGNYYSP